MDHAPPPTAGFDLSHERPWLDQVSAAISAGVAADSPAADPIVADVVTAWVSTQDDPGQPPFTDDGTARHRLLRQLETSTANLSAAGRWLVTALRAHPEPGLREARLTELLDSAVTGPARILDGCAEVLAAVEAIVAAVPVERLGEPTPCADWNVRTLIDHLVYENLMWTSLAEGTPRTDFAADHLGADHVAAFRAAAQATLRTFRRPGLLDQQFGPAPGWRLVEQVNIEMLVHGWDLAKATGQPTDLVPELAETTLPAVMEIYGGLPRTPGGSFGAAQPVPAESTAADRLAAYLGRTI